VEYHLLLARDLELLPAQEHALLQKRIEEIERMLTSFVRRIQPISGTKAQQVHRREA
jgi:four helix bundle protein